MGFPGGNVPPPGWAGSRGRREAGSHGQHPHRLLGSRDGLKDSANPSTCTGYLLNYPAVVDQPKSLLKPNLESMPGCRWKSWSCCFSVLSTHLLHKTTTTLGRSSGSWQWGALLRESPTLLTSQHASAHKHSPSMKNRSQDCTSWKQSYRLPVCFFAVSPSEDCWVHTPSLGTRAVWGRRAKP